MLPKMPSRTSSQLVHFSLKTLSAAVIATTLISSATAAGLGRLTVLSALGQPLNAEIELTSVSKDEAGSLFAKLASAEAFRQANIEFNPALFSVRFGIEQRGARQFIRVTSAQPINEPYVDMLLELGGTNGRLVREYTFLLDPVDLRTGPITAPIAAPIRAPQTAPQVVQTPQPAASQLSSGNASRRPAAEPAVAPAPVPRAAKVKPESTTTASGAGEKTYTVKSGDSLARIANKVRSGGVSLDQMLVALYRANPDAFVGENMNRMRAGQILSVPGVENARAIDRQEAKGVVVAQAQDFSSYRNKLAGQVATASPQKPSEAKQVAGGKITTKVEEAKNPADESKDKLRLSKSGVPPLVAPPAGAVPAKNASVASAEEKIAKDKAVAEANSRVKELEKNVSELQKVLEIKNKDLAEQQKKADLAAKTSAAAAAAALTASAAAKPAIAVVAPVASLEEKKASTPLVVTPPVVAMATPATVPAAASTAAPAASVVRPSAPVAVADVPAPMPTVTPAVTPAPVSVVKPSAPIVKAKPPLAAPAETSFLDDLLGNALLLPALGLLLVGLGAFGIFSSRRKKKSQQFEDSMLTDSNLKANSLFGSTGGQSVDTNNSVFNSNFAPSASQLDANEVDPVAEADVYIAYGRDAQAEEILKEALRTQPERNAVRLKLLEIYATRKDLRSFELMASELYGMTKGQGDDWAHAASMGIALDPNNPMYVGGKAASDAVVHAVAPAATARAADDLDLEALLASTQINTMAGSMNTIAPEVAHLNQQDLDVNTASYLDSAAVKAAKTGVEPPHHAPVSEHGLDFDLEGLGVQDVESKEVLVDPAVLTSDTHNAHSLPFELPAAAAEHPAEAVAFTETKFDAVAVPIAAAGHQPAAIAEDMLEFHMPEAVVPAHPAPAIAATSPAGVVPPVPVHPAPMDFDLSGISLDLNPDAAHDVAPVASTMHRHDTALEASDTLVLEDDEISSTPEMATKLDLAIAYEEIGDKDGARELLDEVIKGGTPDQVVHAKGMLAKLG